MRCKDCIHCNICNKTESDIYLGNKEGAVELYCVEFADESQYIKLPCKVGDTVYVIDDHYGLIECIVNEIHVGVGNELYYNLFYYEQTTDEPDELIDEFDFDNNDIGETVFLTKSEAEKALREVENDV